MSEFYEVHLGGDAGRVTLADISAWFADEGRRRAWVRENVAAGDYRIFGLSDIDFEYNTGKLIDITNDAHDSTLLYKWIERIDFKNETDAMAFKIRFGI